MKNNVVEKVFRGISLCIGCCAVFFVAPYINEFYVQKQYAFLTGKVLGFATSLGVGIGVGVIVYWLYLGIRNIVEKIKSKK